MAVANVTIVDLNNPREFAHRAGAKHFVRAIDVDRRQIRFDAADFFCGANLDHSRARDSFRTRDNFARRQIAFADDENIRCVRFGNASVRVEHERIVRAGVVRFDLRQNRIEQVRVMNLCIENFRRRPARFAGDQCKAGLCVNRRLVFGENDQGGAGLIEPRIHSRRDLHAARNREPNVNSVAHFVGGEGALQLFDDFLARRTIDNRQCARRTLEPVEMLGQFEDPAVVKPQSFPNRVAALHCRIERTDPGFVAMHQLTVDVDDQITVLAIKFLKHLY